MRMPFVSRKEFEKNVEVMESILADAELLKRELDDLNWINLNDNPADPTHLLGMSREQMLKKTRAAHIQNPLLGNAVNLDTWFTFGEGLPMPKHEDPAVQDFIAEFWEDPDNQAAMTSYMAQCALNIKRHREGEFFTVMFTDFVTKRGVRGSGMTRVRFFDSLEIKDVICSPDDNFRPIAYKRVYLPQEYDFQTGMWKPQNTEQIQYFKDFSIANPEMEGMNASFLERGSVIYHAKTNADVNEKRGVPELFRALRWASVNKDANANLQSYASAMARIAWKKTVKGSQAQVNTARARFQQETDMSNPPPAIGAMYVSNQGIELDAINHPTGGIQILGDSVRRSLLMVAAAMNMSENYFGDVSTGNLATAKTTELPLLKKCQASQQFWSEFYGTITRYAIKKAVEVRRLPGKVTFNPLTNRQEVETEFSLDLDFDFAPIAEKETGEFINAINTCVDKNLITKKQAAQLSMTILGVNHIAEEIELLDEAGLLKDEPPPDPFAMEPGFNVPRGTPKPEPKKEAAGVKLKTPKHSPGAEMALKSKRVQTGMVKYRKAIQEAYQRYANKIMEAITQSKKDSLKWHIQGLEDHLAVFEFDMLQAASRHFPEAVNLGKSYVASINPELESLKEADVREVNEPEELPGRGGKILKKRLEWNAAFVSTSLVPALKEDALKTLIKQFDTKEAALAAIAERLRAKESRVEQYAAAFWSVEEESVKEYLKDSKYFVNFVGANDDHTCEECDAAMAGNPWPAEEAPVPGTDTICNGRCRHALQVATELGRTAP